MTPSTRAVGLARSEMRREILSLRRGEPWFAGAAAAFERIQAGPDADQDWDAIAPFFYGRWDATAQAHAANEEQVNHESRGCPFLSVLLAMLGMGGRDSGARRDTPLA